MIYKILITVFLGVVVGVVLLGVVTAQKTSLLASPFPTQEGFLGKIQETTLGRLGSKQPETKEIEQKTAQILEAIKNLPKEELEKVKRQLKQDICEKLFKE